MKKLASEYKLFSQKITLISISGDYQISKLNCIGMLVNGANHIQFPRSIIISDVKYILKRYSIENDCVFYEESIDDPWHNPASPHYKGDK